MALPWPRPLVVRRGGARLQVEFRAWWVEGLKVQLPMSQVKVMATATVTWPEPKKSAWARLVAWLRRKGG